MQYPEAIRVFAIDDDKEYLKSLDAFFRVYEKKCTLIGTRSDVTTDEGVYDLLDILSACKPDVILMDYSFRIANRPDDFGINLTVNILQKLPQSKIIMLVADQDDPDEIRLNKLKRSFSVGACAYLSKGDPAYFISGISESVKGDRFVDPETIKVLVGSMKAAEGFRLTPREIEVLKHLGDDKIAKEIADCMKGEDGKPIAVHTVTFHIRNIKYKMNVGTLHGMVYKACKANII